GQQRHRQPRQQAVMEQHLPHVVDVREYKCTEYYDPASEACLLWNDPEIGIDWPVDEPLLSPKDLQGKLLRELF
ncbi:dTDP-4-dehydrorhamnose 3,5-epimerase family protein, partial [Serratia marcescens]